MKCDGSGRVPNIYRDIDLSLKEDWVNLIPCPGCDQCYTECSYWQNPIGFKCGRCDTCTDWGDQEYHRRKEEE